MNTLRLPGTLLIALCANVNTSSAAQLTVAAGLHSAQNIPGPSVVDGTFHTGLPSIEIDLYASSADGLPAGASFSWTSKASADYGMLKTYFSVNLSNYQPDSYTFYTDDGFGNLVIQNPGVAAITSVVFEDMLTVNSSVNGLIHASFDISGSNSSSISGIETDFVARAPTAFGGSWSYGEYFFTWKHFKDNRSSHSIFRQSSCRC